MRLKIDTAKVGAEERSAVEANVLKEVSLELRSEARSLMSQRDATDDELAMANRMYSAAKDLDELRRAWWEPPGAPDHRRVVAHEVMVS